jgi:hypothetical protein
MMMMIYYQKIEINMQHKKDEAPLRIHSISLVTQAFTPQPRNLARVREMSSQCPSVHAARRLKDLDSLFVFY